MKTYYRALTIAGSDCGGGAGIQADLKTFCALECYGMSVITALTAQNTREVTGIFAVPPRFIGQQMDAVLGDIGTDAVKIGMLHSPEVIFTVARHLEKWQCGHIVLDPVMVAKSGDKLLQDDAVAALKQALIPLADIITPNLPEASVLLGRDITTRADMPGAARELADLGCPHVLLKGGHLDDTDSSDLLFCADTGQLLELPGERIKTPNSHGTGCTLSSAVCAGVAKGMDIPNAVKAAKAYITGALAAGAQFSIGQGHGPVHHFFTLWAGTEKTTPSGTDA